ncbi:hypothetical protein GAY28_38485, partial [Azospirillum brasilense]|nr:hypothetical protein [Azospirillum brasilense]
RGWRGRGGGGGHDLVNGRGRGDGPEGGAGDAPRVGGDGADLLTGGEGNDTFRFTEASQLAGDRIADFSTGDRIDLSALNVTYIGEQPFTGNFQQKGAPQVRLTMSGDDTQLDFDLTGDGTVDGRIILSGSHALIVDPGTPGVLIRAPGTRPLYTSDAADGRSRGRLRGDRCLRKKKQEDLEWQHVQ